MTDAIEVLESDHRDVEDLFIAAESASGTERQQSVNKLAKALRVHAEIEEEIVYPAMKKAGLDSEVSEATQEHQKVEDLVARLEGTDPTSDEVATLMAELKKAVTHHVEEEEGDVFPRFRSAVDQDQLDSLSQDLVAAKNRAMRSQEPRQSRTVAE